MDKGLDEVRSYLQQTLELDALPIPVSTSTGAGIELLEKELFNLLHEQGKDILLGKILKKSDAVADTMILKYSLVASGI